MIVVSTDTNEAPCPIQFFARQTLSGNPVTLFITREVLLANLKTTQFGSPMNSHFISKRVAHQLGIAGFIPFGVLSFACWFADAEWLGVFIRSQFAWSILILSFLGGIHWGATLASSEVTGAQTKKTLLWSVVPALIAWLATMIGGFGFALLIISFIGAYLIDKRLYRWYRLPDWFIHLRFILTCAVIVALMLTVIAANFRG